MKALALKAVAAFCGLATFASGYCQIKKTYEFGDATYGVYITGTNTDGTAITMLGQKLSGTKVELAIGIDAEWAEPEVGEPEPPPPNVITCDFAEIQIYILGGPLPDDTLPNVIGDPGFGTQAGAQYRLASTYFAHNSDINVRVKLKFTFHHDGSGGVSTPTVKEYDETFTFKAYNLWQSAGTDQVYDPNANGGAGGYVFNEVIAGVSTQAVTKMQSYGSAMNHGLQPASEETAMDQSALDILDTTIPATVMTANLHGSATSILDSHALNNYAPFQVGFRIADKSLTQLPQFNFVAYWACSTFSFGASGWAAAYSIDAQSVDRAFFGFPDNLHALCWTADEWNTLSRDDPDPYAAGIPFSRDISDHVEFVLEHLALGKTIGEARTIAHDEVPMVSAWEDPSGALRFDIVPGMIEGDPWMRLTYVWLSEAERAIIEGNAGSIDVSLIKLPIQ